MTDVYLHFLFAHYGLYGNAAVHTPRAWCELCGAVQNTTYNSAHACARYSGFNGTVGAICLHQNPIEATSAGIVMGDDMTHVRAPCCASPATMRADIIGHFKPCMTDIYLHIDARMAD
eukprot:COSAG05_NODE_57_length_23291_cov_75.862668_2_plen_118_part_00